MTEATATTGTASEQSSELATDLPSRRISWSGVLVTPLVLAAALALLFWYLAVQDLDDIEQRSINADTILTHLREHIALVAVSSVLVIVIAVPLGVLLTRPGLSAVTRPLVGLANIGQAVPSIGILVLLAVTVGIGFDMAIVALVLVAVLPVLRNTMIGLSTVDKSLIDAARGMGLTRTSVLLRVELPLAVPVILAGIRIALILNVSSATLATFTNAGGLGTLIATGVALNRLPILITGSVLTAVLALAIDWLAGLAERALRPRGI